MVLNLVDKRRCTIGLLYEFLNKISTSPVEAKKIEFNSSLKDKTTMVLMMGMVPSTHPRGCFDPVHYGGKMMVTWQKYFMKVGFLC
jgi:hypothetical protein